MNNIVDYKEGDIILNDGEIGKGFCILESGSVEVIREGKTLGEIDQPGSIFGELSEILGLKRDATIRAKTPAKVRHLEESIEKIVSKNPSVSVKLIKTLGKRLYRMNRLVSKEMVANGTFYPQQTTGQTEILVVEDKPNIINQLTEIFAKSEWDVRSANDEETAIKMCEETTFATIMISMALPNDLAVDLRRKLKTNHNVLNTPVVAMIVQGDEDARRKAINAGFADCITKPFNPDKTVAVMYKVMSLDSSARYFSFVDDFLYFKVPNELSAFVIDDIKENMDTRIRNTINEGIVKLIIDVSELDEVDDPSLEVVGEFAEKIEDMKIPLRGAIIATGDDAEMWNNLDGCEEWGTCGDLESAKVYLAKDPDDETEE
ncbi:response regulator [Opitutales bacterium]|jgi:DNA-binding response OmpR family regulator|nr:response regulator [Opitutales bacterium]